MQYKLTFEDGSESYLAHHGVLGMKWGVRNADTLRKYFGSGRYDRRIGKAKSKMESANAQYKKDKTSSNLYKVETAKAKVTYETARKDRAKKRLDLKKERISPGITKLSSKDISKARLAALGVAGLGTAAAIASGYGAIIAGATAFEWAIAGGSGAAPLAASEVSKLTLAAGESAVVQTLAAAASKQVASTSIKRAGQYTKALNVRKKL